MAQLVDESGNTVAVFENRNDALQAELEHNEHAALVAVAEAAERLQDNPECQCYPPSDTNSCRYCSAWLRMDKALIALAAVRAGSEVAK